MLAACTPTPEPTPTRTALFSSDEEAYAAAEETYAAYTEAVNGTELSDPATFDPVFTWLTGTALPAEKESLSLYHAEKLTRTGISTYDTFTPISFDDDSVTVNLCVDVLEVDLLNEAGESVIPDAREARSGRKVTFVSGPTPTGLQIQSNHKPDPDFTC